MNTGSCVRSKVQDSSIGTIQPFQSCAELRSKLFTLEGSHGKSRRAWIYRLQVILSVLIGHGSLMSEEIDRHVLRRFEICQKLGKGVSGM